LSAKTRLTSIIIPRGVAAAAAGLSARPARPALTVHFPLFNWPVYWIMGRLCLFILPFFSYVYVTVAIILMVIYWPEPRNSEIITLSP
jgi:hypothetical protein